MIALSAELHDVPRVQIAIPVGTVAVADGDHTRQAKPVAQELDRLGHALADTDAVGQRADDLVRIRLFKLIVANVFHNEIMDRALLLRRWQAAQRTQQPCRARLNCLPVLTDALFVKAILGAKVHELRLRHSAARKTDGVEDLRMIQPQLEKECAERLHREARNARRRRKLPQAGQHTVIRRALRRRKLLIIILRMQLHSHCAPFVWSARGLT